MPIKHPQLEFWKRGVCCYILFFIFYLKLFCLNFILFLLIKNVRIARLQFGCENVGFCAGGVTCTLMGLQSVEQCCGEEANLIVGRITVMAAGDKLKRETEAFCAASVDVEEDTTKLE